MTENILFLCFWTPPVVRPRAIMAGKIIPEMIRQGVKPIIVTYDICGQWNINAPIYPIPEFNIKNKESLIRKIPFMRKLDTLRQERAYFEMLVAHISDIVKKHDIKLIFSYANPQASNIVGAMIKKRLGINFISHFSDPWYDNPYRKSNFLKSAKIFLQERFVVKQSDGIIFTNAQALRLVMKKYSRYTKKTFVIPHCFSKKDYPEIEKTGGGVFTIAHIGVFYAKRTPETLFKAVTMLLKTNPDIAKRLHLRLIGATDEYSSYGANELKRLIQQYNLEHVTDVVPRVGYQESLGEMKEADCLLVIDAPGESSPFLPSKIIDYAGSGTPMFGITPNGSPTAEFLKAANYSAFNHDDIEGLSSHIFDLAMGKHCPIGNHGFINSYTVESIVTNLLTCFKEITHGNKI